MKRLVGLAEVARLLEVSRQRAHQLADSDPNFPKPEGSVAGRMRVWKESDVKRYVKARRANK